jgi:hypothetical protein
MADNGSPIKTDGSLNFQGGVDSLKPTTVATQANPNGLRRDQLAWLINGSVRDGGIEPRAAWLQLYKLIGILDPALVSTIGYQGGFLYRPLDGNPYFIFSVGGVIYKALPDGSAPTNLSAASGLKNPTNVDHGYFCQGEQFLVIQAGDGVTLPLFWDGTTLRRSNGLIPNSSPNSGPQIISTNNQPSFVVPALGGTLALNWTTTPPVGSTVVIQNHGTTLQTGQFLVNTVAGTLVTMTMTSANNAAYAVSAANQDLVLITVATAPPKVSELPAGYAMDYYMQRIWYVFGDQRTYTAGDIVGNTSSGTKPYNFTDSILKVTENPLALGGDGFHIPSDGGNIRALAHTANLDASLGQGLLYISTRKQIYSLKVPVSRADWINANSTNAPLQTVVQLTNGATGDRCVVPVNGDLYYQALEPSVRSLIIATRYFGQPGNTPISNPENRIIQFNDRALLSFATGIEFNNRMLQSALPRRISQGVVHDAILPLDFTPLNEPKSNLASVWEGHYEGLQVLQMFTADFGGLQRAFAIIVSSVDGGIWLWEFTQAGLVETDDKRITWQIEFPAFNWGDDFSMKKLQGGELWIDRLSGTVEFTLEYRPDGYSCYIPWIAWKECSARDCQENIPPICPAPLQYPVPLKQQGLGYRQTIGFPNPPTICDTQMDRPSNEAHQFQCRLTIKGSCRVRGFFLHASEFKRGMYVNVPCAR